MTTRLVVLAVAMVMLTAAGCRQGASCATCGPNPYEGAAITSPGAVLPYTTPQAPAVGAPANVVPYTP